MARPPRLAVPGHAHYLIQRGHNGQPVFFGDEDRAFYLAALREAAATHKLAVHAYALLDSEVHLLATPPDAEALSRTMQALGRVFVAGYNRRHDRSGTLWEGRFRAAVVEPGATLLAALQLIDALPAAEESRLHSSALHRLGRQREPMLIDPPEYWRLGNTPFEREAVWRTLLVQGLPKPEVDALQTAALRGGVLGSAAFVQALSAATLRPLRPRPRGRPRKTPV
jgi:putative transposase